MKKLAMVFLLLCLATPLLAIDVNSDPTITGTVAGQTMMDNERMQIFTGVTIGDADSDWLMVGVMIDDPAKGRLGPKSVANGGFFYVGDGIWGQRFLRRPSGATKGIRRLRFVPNENRVPPGQTEIARFAIIVFDGGGGILTSEKQINADSFAGIREKLINNGVPSGMAWDENTSVIITSFNDPISLGKIEDQTCPEDRRTPWIPLVIKDPDVGGFNIHGWGFDKTLVPNNSIEFKGRDKAVHVIPASNQSGETRVSIRVYDSTSDFRRDFILTVTPVNDAPVWIEDLLPLEMTAGVQFKQPLEDWLDKVEDPDMPGETLTFSITKNDEVTTTIANDTVYFDAPGTFNGNDTLEVTVSDGSESDKTELIVIVSGGTPSTSEPDQTTGILGSNGIPVEFSLNQNYPNPFNPTTSINFDLPVQSHVSLTVYNTAGQKIAELVNGFKSAGSYTMQWDASSMGAGIYFYKLQTDEFTQIRRAILIK